MLTKITIAAAMVAILGMGVLGLNKKRTDCWVTYATHVSTCQGSLQEVDRCANVQWQALELCERRIWS